MGYADLLGLAEACQRRLRVGVVYPDYDEIFRALVMASGLCFEPILIGPEEETKRRADEAGLAEFRIIHAADPQAAAAAAVAAASSGEMELLMKGSVPTAILMKAVLADRDGLRGHSLLSHVAVFESPDGRFIGVTDGGLNINPTIEQKIHIIRNAVTLFHHIGVPTPKVALLSGVEVLTPAIPSTVEAVELAAMGEKGAFPDALVEGPLAFDLAFNPAASRAKKYGGRIRGDADIMVVPEIVAGNILGKSLNHAAGYASGGVIMGARIPIVLLSRSDRAQEKFNSLLLAGALV